MTGQSSPSPEPWSQEAEKARLDKYGSSLDRWNVNHVCERIADYPEFLAAIAALPGLREQIAQTLCNAEAKLPIGQLATYDDFADALLAGFAAGQETT